MSGLSAAGKQGKLMCDTHTIIYIIMKNLLIFPHFSSIHAENLNEKKLPMFAYCPLLVYNYMWAAHVDRRIFFFFFFWQCFDRSCSSGVSAMNLCRCVFSVQNTDDVLYIQIHQCISFSTEFPFLYFMCPRNVRQKYWYFFCRLCFDSNVLTSLGEQK